MSPTTRHGGSERRCRDGAHPARPLHPEPSRTRAPGLTEANRLWPKGEGGNRSDKPHARAQPDQQAEATLDVAILNRDAG